MPLEEIYGIEQFRDVVNSKATTVIFFTAVWCGPCRTIYKDFEKLSYERPTLRFIKVDIDTNPDIAMKCKVNAVPTFMFVRAGEQLGYLVGGDANQLKLKVRDLE